MTEAIRRGTAGRTGVGMAPPHMGRAEAWQSPPGGSGGPETIMAGARAWNQPIFMCEISQKAAAINKDDGLIAVNHNPADIPELSQAAGMLVWLVVLSWQRQERD